MYRFMPKHSSDHYVLLFCHDPIMNKVVNESMRKICHYQQNVPQHYYLVDFFF